MYPLEELHYAQQRLNNTIIRHMGKAVSVLNITDEKGDALRVSSVELLTDKLISDKVENYDLTPVTLGFVNGKRSISYVARTPMRKDWRQGLRRENIRALYNDLNWDAKALARTIENEFPTVEEAILASKKGSQAWHRDFAVEEGRFILHKYYGRVGEFLDGMKDKFVLNNNFFWCEEALKEAL